MNSHSCVSFRAPEKVFDPSNWDPLIEKVLGRLERSVRDTPIKPDGQDRCRMIEVILWRMYSIDYSLCFPISHSPVY